jgi:hypothetical protein
MAKKSKNSSHGVKKIGQKYVCEECQAEIPIRQECPNCKKEIDWERVLLEIER